MMNDLLQLVAVSRLKCDRAPSSARLRASLKLIGRFKRMGHVIEWRPRDQLTELLLAV